MVKKLMKTTLLLVFALCVVPYACDDNDPTIENFADLASDMGEISDELSSDTEINTPENNLEITENSIDGNDPTFDESKNGESDTFPSLPKSPEESDEQNEAFENQDLDELSDSNSKLLKRNQLVKTISEVTPYYEVSFNIIPRGIVNDWGSIIHLTTGGNSGTIGFRIPAVWFHGKTTKLHICSAINKEDNHCWNSPNGLPLNKLTKVLIRQNAENGKLLYKIFIDGKEVYNKHNLHPETFKVVKLYSADNWYLPANAEVTDIKFKNLLNVITGKLSKNHLIDNIKTLTHYYEVSFDIKPIVIAHGWRNIIHFTTGGNHGKLGQRTPGIWFQSQTTKLHICSAINNKYNYCVNSPTSLPINKYSNILVQQISKNGHAHFIAKVNGKVILDVRNDHPYTFDNVKVYATDPWYHPAEAVLQSYKFKNLQSHTNLLKKSQLVKTIPEVTPYYELSFNIIPRGYKKDWSNVIHLTTFGNHGTIGYRTPAVWFHSKTSKLHICSAINKEDNHCWNSPKGLLLNKLTNIIIRQNADNGNLLYKIFIDGKEVYSKHNLLPVTFKNVKLYSADPWYNPANAEVTNIKFKNLYSVAKHELKLSRNRLHDSIKTLSPYYEVSFDIKPIVRADNWRSIIHFTTGGNHGKLGQRTPGIWFHSQTTKLHICSAINNNNNHCINPNTELPVNKFSSILVQQYVINEFIHFVVKINGKIAGSVRNEQPYTFKDVKVYAADPWYESAEAIIKNYKFKNNQFPLERSNVVKTINKYIGVEYELSFSVKPLARVNGWSNIIHATTGKNIEDYGSRLPGVWFISKTTQLHICASINGIKNACHNVKTPLVINKYSQIKISQKFIKHKDDKGKFYYIIAINGKAVYFTENKDPRIFQNVVLYAADKWYHPAQAQVKDIKYENKK